MFHSVDDRIDHAGAECRPKKVLQIVALTSRIDPPADMSLSVIGFTTGWANMYFANTHLPAASFEGHAPHNAGCTSIDVDVSLGCPLPGGA